MGVQCLGALKGRFDSLHSDHDCFPFSIAGKVRGNDMTGGHFPDQPVHQHPAWFLYLGLNIFIPVFVC